MGKLLNEIGSGEAAFIARQKVFFVATAPLNGNHHVNLSPKAPGSSVVVLGSHKVAYADLTGSGAETAAHVMENGRMTLMFCNLQEGPPKILRLYGRAELLVKENIDKSLLEKFPTSLTQTNPGFRSVFILNVERISSSCGYSLPIMTYQKTRSTLDEYAERKGIEGMNEYCLYKNSFSIDGLPSVAQVRNPNLVIAPKPEEGYIYGRVVSKKDPSTEDFKFGTSYHYYKPQPVLSPKLLLIVVIAFFTGALSGYSFPRILGNVQSMKTSCHENFSTVFPPMEP